MHANFYHWHNRAEIKPEIDLLEPRWNAAAAFAEDASVEDLKSLLSVAFFSGGDTEFTTRYSAELVKREPTFPPSENANLLRVMATASAYSLMEEHSDVATAVALGIRASDFPSGRADPVCQDIGARAAEYLSVQSEANTEGVGRRDGASPDAEANKSP